MNTERAQIEKLQALHDLEMCFVIHSFSDQELSCRITGPGVDVYNGNFRNISEAVDWLWQAARFSFPNTKCFKEEK